MPSHRRPCTTPGCAGFARTGRCEACQNKTANRRPSARARGYDTDHEKKFRAAVLARQPWCKCGKRRATHADHYPKTRRQLVAAGLDPNDPRYGRGLCESCHMKWTAEDSPGGWNADRD